MEPASFVRCWQVLGLLRHSFPMAVDNCTYFKHGDDRLSEWSPHDDSRGHPCQRNVRLPHPFMTERKTRITQNIAPLVALAFGKYFAFPGILHRKPGKAEVHDANRTCDSVPRSSA